MGNDLAITISGGVIEVGSDELPGLLKRLISFYIELNIKAKHNRKEVSG